MKLCKLIVAMDRASLLMSAFLALLLVTSGAGGVALLDHRQWIARQDATPRPKSDSETVFRFDVSFSICRWTLVSV